MSPTDHHRRPPAPPAGGHLRIGKVASNQSRCFPLRTLATLLIALALAVACGAGREDSISTTGSSAAEDSQETNPVRGTGVEDDEPEPEDGDGGQDAFVGSGESSGGEAGAADRIEDVRFQIFDGYERLIVGFGGGERKVGVPRWTVESPEEGGYVRLRFPGVHSTRLAHEDFVGSTLNELYVVRDRGGGLFVDVFGTHGFRYRVTDLPESGRLPVDLCGIAEEIRFPPTTGNRSVVLQPREAEEVESPINVRGYARLFEGQVTASLRDRERDVLPSKTVRINDWATAWDLFQTTLEFSGYEGLATLRVGGRSAKDGSFVGTETEVFLEGSGPG